MLVDAIHKLFGAKVAAVQNPSGIGKIAQPTDSRTLVFNVLNAVTLSAFSLTESVIHLLKAPVEPIAADMGIECRNGFYHSNPSAFKEYATKCLEKTEMMEALVSAEHEKAEEKVEANENLPAVQEAHGQIGTATPSHELSGTPTKAKVESKKSSKDSGATGRMVEMKRSLQGDVMDSSPPAKRAKTKDVVEILVRSTRSGRRQNKPITIPRVQRAQQKAKATKGKKAGQTQKGKRVQQQDLERTEDCHCAVPHPFCIREKLLPNADDFHWVMCETKNCERWYHVACLFRHDGPYREEARKFYCCKRWTRSQVKMARAGVYYREVMARQL